MIILATGIIQASFKNDGIIVNVESGESCFDLSLSVHQATWLAVALADAINSALQPASVATSNVVPFCRPPRRQPD